LLPIDLSAAQVYQRDLLLRSMNLRSEPVPDPRHCAYQPHIRSPLGRLHHNPACGGNGSGVDDTHLDDGM
jgi:hypothetical protein